MRINYCTITGADDRVDPCDLIELSNRYPFVEWGILCSRSRAGTFRYPSNYWIANFIDDVFEIGAEVNRSAHLCGEYARKFVSHEMKYGFLECFQRIQVNGSFDNLEALKFAVNFAKPMKIITQHNKANEKVFSKLLTCNNHQLLFDASGGCGIPGQWQRPYSHLFCGYAGGLGPDNLAYELKKIQAVAGDTCIWVDMESGIRTSYHLNGKTIDMFDLEKVEKCLRIVEKFNLSQ